MAKPWDNFYGWDVRSQGLRIFQVCGIAIHSLIVILDIKNFVKICFFLIFEIFLGLYFYFSFF